MKIIALEFEEGAYFIGNTLEEIISGIKDARDIDGDAIQDGFEFFELDPGTQFNIEFKVVKKTVPVKKGK